METTNQLEIVQKEFQEFLHGDDWHWNADFDNYGNFYNPELISRHEDMDSFEKEEEDDDDNNNLDFSVGGFAQRRYEEEYIRSAIQRLPRMLKILEALGTDEVKEILQEINENADDVFEHPKF